MEPLIKYNKSTFNIIFELSHNPSLNLFFSQLVTEKFHIQIVSKNFTLYITSKYLPISNH